MNLIEKIILFIIFIIGISSFIWGNIIVEVGATDLKWFSLRMEGLIIGTSLLICTVYAFFKYNYKNIFKNFNFKTIDLFVLLFFVIYGLFSAINGFLRQNDIVYIIGDTYHCFAFAFLYFFSTIFVQNKNIKKIIEFSVYFIFILIIADAIYAFYRYFDLGYFRKTAGYFFILPFIFFFIKYLRYQSQGKPFQNTKTLVYLFISIVLVFLTISLALAIAMFLLIMLVTFFLTFSKKNYLQFILLLIFLIVFIFSLDLSGTSIFQRISPLSIIANPESAYSYSYRIEEVVSIFNTMENNYFNFLIGMGQGAFRLLPQETIDKLSLRAEDLHTIHFTPGSIFLRMGLLGLTIFSLFLLTSLLYLYNQYKKSDCLQQSNKFYLEVILLFFIAAIILSIRGYGIINAPLLAIFLGLARNQNFIINERG